MTSTPQLPCPRVVGPIECQNPDWKCGFFNFGRLSSPEINYFNCGLVRRPDGLWLITRRSKKHPNIDVGMNDIACFELGGPEEKFPGKAMVAKIESPFPGQEHFEDPRAVYHNGITYLQCCNFIMRSNRTGWTGAHQIVAAMNDDWSCVRRYDPVYGGNGPYLGANTKIEKNWIWFFHDDFPHLIYLTFPHTVVRCDESFNPVETFTTTYKLGWKYGDPRGGTPPTRIGDEYWSFFHSSTNWRTQSPTRQYHMGAYVFEAKPPFRITHMTAEPLLSGSPFNTWVQTKPLSTCSASSTAFCSTSFRMALLT